MKESVFEIRDDFYLGGKPFKIISGAIHYFRIVPEYWRDRLEKLKAMGANTVETYVPWNMHEPQSLSCSLRNWGFMSSCALLRIYAQNGSLADFQHGC